MLLEYIIFNGFNLNLFKNNITGEVLYFDKPNNLNKYFCNHLPISFVNQEYHISHNDL